MGDIIKNETKSEISNDINMSDVNISNNNNDNTNKWLAILFGDRVWAVT